MHDRRNFADLARSSNSTDTALSRLHEVGVSPMQAIVALVEGRSLSLADAKLALHASPYWSTAARAAEDLQNELIDELLSDSQEPGNQRAAGALGLLPRLIGTTFRGRIIHPSALGDRPRKRAPALRPG